ncbi:MAG: glutamate--cysteine ligase [Alphaproteobacteria bacterium]|nr:glutamate--cysteine ligase [Alphaproteobacteria bacterium]
MIHSLTYDDLIEWFHNSEKTDQLIGSEHEKFLYHQNDLTPVTYQEIAQLLHSLHQTLGGDAIMEGANIIGLKTPPLLGDKPASITLEPGGQFELSGAPLKNLHLTCQEITCHINLMQTLCAEQDYGMLALGYLPQYQVADIPKMPKKRYDIMRQWMPKQGLRGLDMMHLTTTVQVNLDYKDMQDMAQKMRIGAVLQPFATALFASSPLMNGAASKYNSARANVWLDTDASRCGMPDIIFADDFNYQMWLDYLLDVPVYFLNRATASNPHDYVDVGGATFRALMQDAGAYAPITLDDFIGHASTVFPDLRLKNVIEMRGADCSKFTLCALPAFWVGLLYDDANQAKLYDMLSGYQHRDILTLREQVVTDGMNLQWDGKSMYEWAELLLPMAQAGLQRRKFYNANHEDESSFLNGLFDIVETRETISDRVRAAYHKYHGDMRAIYDEFGF